MELQDIKNYIDTNLGNEDVKNYVGSLITTDRVNTFLEGEDGKKLLQPKLDSYHSKSLESWKTNNLSKLVDEEFKKKYPEKDKKDMELEKLKAEFEAMKNESSKKELTNKGLKLAQEKKLPIELVDFFVGQDEETTIKNIESLEKIFASHIENLVAERLKGSSYTPPKGGSATTFTMEQISKMSTEEINANWEAISKSTIK